VNVYREQSLKKAMEYGAVVVPTSELSRLLRAPAFQKDETVLFSVGRDSRRIYLRSLFYREDLYDSPTSWNKLEQQTRLWLDDVRRLRSPAEEKAQTLAWFFWLKSRSAESRLRYRERRTSDDLVIPWLLGRHWTQEHAVRRLAVFFLMLIESGFRAFALRASEEAIKMPGEFSYDKYRRFLDRVREILELLQEATLSEKQKDNVDNVRQFLEKASLEHDVKEFESVAGPLTDIDVIRLVDPLPDLSDIVITLNKAERIGNALDNLNLDIPGLLEGYDRCVTDHTEQVHLVRFARELITDGFFQSTEEWPPWLVRVDARLSGG
jgi:hypothetical protein